MSNDNFLDLAQLDAIPDQTILDDGSEHVVQIISAKIGESKPEAKTAGQSYLMVTYKAEDDPDSAPFNDVFMLPFNGLEKEKFNQRGRALRAFFKCFEFDYTSGWDIFTETDQLKGLTGNVIVRVDDNDQYGEQNSVKKYL